jgi:hypothetical protein
VLCMARVDLLQAFGRGSGQNRVLFSPLDVAAFTSVHAARLRGQDSLVKAALAGVAIPGEIFRRVTGDGNMGMTSEIWENAQKWTRDAKLKQIVKPKEDIFSGIAAMICLLSMFVAFFSPKNASLMFFMGLIGMQTSLKGFEPTVRFTDDYGNYAAVMSAVASVLL